MSSLIFPTRRSSLGLGTDALNDFSAETEEDDGDEDAASIALQTAVNNLSQLSASVIHPPLYPY